MDLVEYQGKKDQLKLQSNEKMSSYLSHTNGEASR